MRFEGKTVIVTGAASGFGTAIAAQFGAEGAHVVAADINLDGARKVADAIVSEGGKAIAVACDVRSGPDNKAMIDAAVEAFGQLDITINNAGLGHMSAPMHELPEEGYDLVFDTNTKSIYWSVKYAVPEMIKAGGGVIINTASLGAKRPRPNV
ncbi:MAG TPA: short chain dehydrogenase, partial [Alphaproteobacteria bacterium]|nr:short chain dehydrogenase [Alphaproteobacteria bacterium]HBF97225.1 short chain dehydrogenase [Alphaproteobacteria bacterium]